MKKFTLLFLLLFVAIGYSIAQIKVASNGNVGINNTSPSYKLDVAGNMRITAYSNSVFFTGSYFAPDHMDYVDLGSFSNFWYNLYAQTAYFYYEPYIMSDIKIKTDIKEVPTIKDKVNLLRPITYKLNPELPENTPQEIQEDITNKVQYGFIAQEVQEIFPEVIAEGEDGLLSIQYAGLIPVLVKAFKEQQAEIDALYKKIEELESKIK